MKSDLGFECLDEEGRKFSVVEADDEVSVDHSLLRGELDGDEMFEFESQVTG